jgi:hypothetical protein
MPTNTADCQGLLTRVGVGYLGQAHIEDVGVGREHRAPTVAIHGLVTDAQAVKLGVLNIGVPILVLPLAICSTASQAQAVHAMGHSATCLYAQTPWPGMIKTLDNRVWQP